MAYIRSLCSRSSLVRRRQYHPSLFSYILHCDDDNNRNQKSCTDEGGMSNLLQQQQIRGFGSGFNRNSPFALALFPDRKRIDFSISPSIGASFCWYMSSTTVGEGSSDNIELMTDVVTDTTLQSAVPAVNEVAVAAADCFLPVALLQHFTDSVHSFTGLNWWAAIMLTTILIRGATLPLLINQLKATSKLTLMRPRMEEIKQQMQDKAMDPTAVTEGQKQMMLLFKEYGASPFTPLKGLFIQGPVFVCFFLAISNMAEKVPSFKSGGAYWFVDLSTPDSLYIFPLLTALTFLITVECNMQEGMEGNPAANTMKNVSRVLAVASVPFMMGFPKAIFCYWVTSNLFSLTYGLVLKYPGVKKFLGVPEMPVAPASTASQSSFNLYAALKQALAARQEPATSLPVESSKISDQGISSTSVLSQRIRSLEKQVKGRKKNKKR